MLRGGARAYESLHEEGMFAMLTGLHACSWRLRYLLGCTGEDGLDILSILLQVIDRARAAKAEGGDREAWKVLHDVGAWAATLVRASGKHGYTSLSQGLVACGAVPHFCWRGFNNGCTG